MKFETHNTLGKNYIIHVGNTCFQEYFNLNNTKYNTEKIFILVDENTEKFCLPLLFKYAPFLVSSQIITIVSGEIHKNLNNCQYIWNKLTMSGADRNSLLINLGGGVICDMGGFIASTFKRGIEFINIPTTLLAMTDASFGGKTGIDFNGLKNQLGVFSNPQSVLIFPEFLKTLDKRQIRNGYTEIIKHALISDKNYWKKIQKINPDNFVNWQEIIAESIKIKLAIIEQDPYEQNIRKKLNFGHTIGHAIESWSLENDKAPLLHGEAVAIGMICETYLSYKTNNLSLSIFDEIKNYLFNTFQKYLLNENHFEKIIKLLDHDKKNLFGKINFVLLLNIGVCEYDKNCTKKIIYESLKFYSEYSKYSE